jgi:PAS domain S-box-containing protein
MNAATHDMFGLQNKILQNMVEGVLLTRVSDAVIIFANPRFETLFGYQKGELIGKNVSILDAPEGKSPEAQASEIQNRLKKTGVWQGEIRTIKKDGTPLWCRIKVSTFDHSEYGTVLIGVYEDITERKKAQDALRLRESYLTAIIENQPGLVWLKDRDGKFLAVNNSFAKSCNLDDPRLLLGKTDFDILIRS